MDLTATTTTARGANGTNKKGRDEASAALPTEVVVWLPTKSSRGGSRGSSGFLALSCATANPHDSATGTAMVTSVIKSEVQPPPWKVASVRITHAASEPVLWVPA